VVEKMKDLRSRPKDFPRPDMAKPHGIKPRGFDVVGPTGEPMTRDDLPSPNTKRWVIRRKAEVVAGVRAGLITIDEACERYSLSIDEFLSWQRLLAKHGLPGLRTTRIKTYRADQA
jgi:hypothetical protein